MADTIRHRVLPRGWNAIVIAMVVAAVALSIYQLFNLGSSVGWVILDLAYLDLLVALLLPIVFLVFPMRAADKDRAQPPLYDVALFVLTFALGSYLAWNAVPAVEEGWEYLAPDHARWASFVLWILMIEGARRAAGLALTIIVLLFSFYPPVADLMPGPLNGAQQPLWEVGQYYAFSAEAVFGIPMRAFGKLVIGFVIFGIALQHTGAGRFFIDLAFALLGHVRGGGAKVAIFSSGLLGSMSGSVITNVLTTGTLTIPAMRRTGFDRQTAAAVEACASTGGVLMPPVMGATAFVMASFIEVPYVDIAIAAVIPSILYYLGLFLQIDAYAARKGLQGLPREELPRLLDVFKKGWHYLFSLALLVWMLLYLKQEAMAPFYATAVLLATNQIFGKRLGLSGIRHFFLETGKVLAELVAILGAIGLIVGALSVTGLTGSLATDLILLAGGSVFALLLMGAATSFVLGMGMTVTAAYVFLAIVLAPSLVSSGLDPMAVHLFILYWGMLSFITPPVALGAFAAATISGSDPMRAGFTAMRIGSIIYFIPFFFVMEPALILRGETLDILVVLASALVGVTLVAGATQSYLVGFGRLGSGSTGWLAKALVFVGGLLFAFPGSEDLGVGHWEGVAAGAVVAAIGLVTARLARSATDLAA
ncbi:TRAP transporter permease [Thalassobaculum fulvum]|uniref:TRAP transporter permease n=1 Tax=Thalassobaculum fulvum TaxID=1633335 RepID=UPI001E444C6D|nr:TRAP transporter fused permease subunit [Thalassobaculum fulvum]